MGYSVVHRGITRVAACLGHLQNGWQHVEKNVSVKLAVLPACVVFASSIAAADPASVAPPPFEAATLQTITLPAEVKSAAQPAYAQDGNHLLFFANARQDGKEHLWIVGTDGNGATCLTCGDPNEPAVNGASDLGTGEWEQPGLIAPFPDGQRVFFGPYGAPAVLECSPSVLNCQTHQILPIDLSGARPSAPVTLPSSPQPSQAIYAPSAASPKLSPDGQYIAFSDIRSDAVEVMVMAKLTRGASTYVTSDPVVLNPMGPTSASDTDVDAWSRSAALYEFKSFVDGGAAITYVQVGGDSALNADVWKLNLATGERTRLTSNPDWDEDMAISPDGLSMVMGSGRGQHSIEEYSLFPVRTFFDAPFVGALAATTVAGALKRSCMPFAPRLLPATGDSGGALMGQNLMPYTGGDVRYSLNITGWPMWSHDSTAVALSTQSFTTLEGAPYLVIAHLPRQPSSPLPIVSSAPGAWAPTQDQYHGAFGTASTVTLSGKSSGTVVVSYNDPQGLLSGVYSAAYNNYSDDGKSFVSGTIGLNFSTIVNGQQVAHYTADMTMTGAHTGSWKADLMGTLADNSSGISGTTTATYDGTTITGPRSTEDHCDTIRDDLGGPVPLNVTVSGNSGQLSVLVTAAYGGAGQDHKGVDERPVSGATVKSGDQTATTDENGMATLSKSNGIIQVSAGDSFAPTSVSSGQTSQKSNGGGSFDPKLLACLLILGVMRLKKVSVRRH